MNKHKLGKVIYWLIPVISLYFSSALALPIQGVSVTTFAEYRGASSGPATQIAGNPGTVNSTSQAGPGGGGIGTIGVSPQTPVDTFDEAIARGRAALPGTLGSYSHAGGFSPGFGAGAGPVSATTSSQSLTHWVATSIDPSVTTVAIDVLAFFDGTMATGDFAGVGPGDLSARVDAQLSAFTDGGSLYDLALNAALDGSTGLTASAGWAGSVTSGINTFGNVRQATIDYTEFFEDAFVVNIGEVFAWDVMLDTSAFATGPFELWAISDFFNTGGFDLSVNTAGITLIQVSGGSPPPVPEPGMLLLLLIGLLALRWVSRRNCLIDGLPLGLAPTTQSRCLSA